MITEHQLERALKLKDEIKELRVAISKLENAKISLSTSIGSKISIDNNSIDVNEFTLATLKRFHNEIVNDYRHKLHTLEEEYNSIICSPEAAFEKFLLDDEDGDRNNGKKEKED